MCEKGGDRIRVAVFGGLTKQLILKINQRWNYNNFVYTFYLVLGELHYWDLENAFCLRLKHFTREIGKLPHNLIQLPQFSALISTRRYLVPSFKWFSKMQDIISWNENSFFKKLRRFVKNCVYKSRQLFWQSLVGNFKIWLLIFLFPNFKIQLLRVSRVSWHTHSVHCRSFNCFSSFLLLFPNHRSGRWGLNFVLVTSNHKLVSFYYFYLSCSFSEGVKFQSLVS